MIMSRDYWEGRAREFNDLKDIEKWAYVLEHRDEIVIYLDNDLTYGHFINDDHDQEEYDDRVTLDFDWYLGYPDGLQILLSAIGINFELV